MEPGGGGKTIKIFFGKSSNMSSMQVVIVCESKVGVEKSKNKILKCHSLPFFIEDTNVVGEREKEKWWRC